MPIHLAGITRLCDRFPAGAAGETPDEDPIPRLWCSTALRAAARVVPDGIEPTRAWFGYGSYCPPGADCPALEPARDIGWVVFEAADAAFLVRVEGTDHPAAVPVGLTVAPAGPARVPSPATRAPRLPHDPPDAIADRDPLPFCGWIEPYGSAPTGQAVRCFVRRVMAGLPAEIIQTYPTTEGDPITDVLRYTGSGAIRLDIDATQDAFGSGRWERGSCGLELVETGPAVTLEDCRDRGR